MRRLRVKSSLRVLWYLPQFPLLRIAIREGRSMQDPLPNDIWSLREAEALTVCACKVWLAEETPIGYFRAWPLIPSLGHMQALVTYGTRASCAHQQQR